MDTSEPAPSRRRVSRRATWLAASIALALACAAVFAWTAASIGEEQTTVLVAAAPIAAGQVIADTDLAEAHVGADDAEALGAVGAADFDDVLGQTTTVPLTTGALITAAVLGTAQVPAPGRVETTVLAADGRWPSRLQPGQSVAVLSGAETGDVWSAAATVLAVEEPEAGGALITLELAETDAAGLALVPSESLLIVTAPPPTPQVPAADGTVSPSAPAGGDDQ